MGRPASILTILPTDAGKLMPKEGHITNKRELLLTVALPILVATAELLLAAVVAYRAP